MTPAGVSAPGYTEDALVERPAIALFKQLGWQAINAYAETFGPGGTLGRDTDQEVVLAGRLRTALARLNPGFPEEALTTAIEELCRDRSTLSAEAANREIYTLLKGGVEGTFKDAEGLQTTDKVKVIDWRSPANNDCLLVSQFWVSGDLYRRRCDLVGFVNGLPLLFVELKASHRRLENAYRANLRDYRTTVPHLFWYNGLLILSNGSESRIGSTTAEWEHFGEWKRINDEGEQGRVSLETMIRGTCEPARFLDIIEHFTVFEESKGGLIKKLGRTHQVLGVNRAIQAVREIQTNKGRLGVFWHTQGSGKVETLLDRSIATEGYVIPGARETPPAYGADRLVDLSRIDFDKLREQFEKARKRTEIEKLRGQLYCKVLMMAALNKTRVDFAEKFQRMIDEYNAGSLNIEEFFERLIRFAQNLNAEERRGVAEGLTEEELALFDLLTKPDPTLSGSEQAQVKKVARTLLETLKAGKLVLDWRKRQQSRQAVRVCIEEVLDTLPAAYSPEMFQRKCDLTYQHVYDAYYGEGRSIYAAA